MYRLALLVPVLGILFCSTAALAALTPAYYTNQSQTDCFNPAQPCGTSDKIITFYVPHSAPNCRTSLQGCIETSKVGLDGRNDPISVDAVRLGKAKYATCASDPSNYRKYFNVGTVTYRSALDQQRYTVQNVICYVHDTGGAFQGRPAKLDLATTLCPTCSESEARAIGSGAAVKVAGIGPLDYNFGRGTLGSVDTGYPAGIGAGRVFDHDYYCVKSIEPVVVIPVPAGTPFPSDCYNSAGSGNALAQPPLPPMMPAPISQPSVAQQIGQQISKFFSSDQGLSAHAVTPQVLLIAQPLRVKRGNPILVSWSSVGMSPQTPCRVSANGQSIAQTNTGSKIIQTASLQAGTQTFMLSCTAPSGPQMQQSASVTII